jgi:hypothetical protein
MESTMATPAARPDAADERVAVDALITDLQWQIDQMKPRGIKDNAGKPYKPAHYNRGLKAAVEQGEVVEYVRRYVYKAPSDGFKKLEAKDSLDLACEALVADEGKPYASLFTEEDRVAACERLAPHAEKIEARKSEYRARIDAARAKLRKKGLPMRDDLEASLRSRRSF